MFFAGKKDNELSLQTVTGRPHTQEKKILIKLKYPCNTMLIYFDAAVKVFPNCQQKGEKKKLCGMIIKAGMAAVCMGDVSDGEAELENHSGLRDRFADNPRQVALLPPPTGTRSHLAWRSDMRLRSRSSHVGRQPVGLDEHRRFSSL